jgi:hypothetical protein
MEVQQLRLETDTSRKTKWANYFHPRFDGTSIPTMCEECKTEGRPFQKPHFSINHPNHVIVHNRKCPACKGTRIFIPKKGLYTKGESCLLSTAPILKPRQRYNKLLQSPENLSPHQNRPVDSYCLRCREQTEVEGGSKVHTDVDPNWTLGHTRPLYVERRAQCLNCKKLKRHSGRFIPVDERIPSILGRLLADLEDHFGEYDDCVLASLMDHWPPSSRTYYNRRDGGLAVDPAAPQEL